MIPEPNLWADLRERDRGLDEVEYPPHHLEAVAASAAAGNTRTLPRNSGGGNCDHHGHYLKEELELEPGGSGGNGSASAVTVSSAASMNNVTVDAEVLRQRQRWTRRWYLLVIVLLYIGLLASFSLNVSLLLRKPPPVTRTVASSSASDSATATSSSLASDGNSLQSEGKTILLQCIKNLSSGRSNRKYAASRQETCVMLSLKCRIESLSFLP